MDIFLDTADVNEISKWMGHGVVDGVTTNPSIMYNDGVYDLEKGAREIAALIDPRPVSVEVTTNDLEEMLQQGRSFAAWAPNIVVKIPVINAQGTPCLEVVHTLAREGIKVNVTACLSFGQAVLAAKAGATYVSIFAGRVWDEGHDASQLIRMTADWLESWYPETRLIAGSIREAIYFQEAATSGAHVVTVPPKVLARVLDHKYTRDTVREFVANAQRTLEEMERLRARSPGRS